MDITDVRYRISITKNLDSHVYLETTVVGQLTKNK